MKNLKQILYLLPVWLLSLNLSAQTPDYYVQLEDASGFDTSPYQAELEAVAAELCHLFDSAGFVNQFRVYDFGFYLHQEVTEGGYPEPFAQKVAQVQQMSPYYLLFGKQTDKTGVYTRFWVDLRLPTTNNFTCLDTTDREMLKISIDLRINNVYNGLQKLPNYYHEAEMSGLERLKDEVYKQIECCYYSKGSSSCEKTCLAPEEIKLLLERNGFYGIPIKILGPIQAKGVLKNKSLNNRVEDCAETSIEVEGIVFSDLGNTINNILSCFADSTATGIILNDSCYCFGEIEYINYIIKNNSIAIRIYIWKNPISSFPDFMFIKTITPNFLGTLPFRGHSPKKINNETLSIDSVYIKNTVTSIYNKNGFSIESYDFNEPANLKALDLYNEIRDYNTNSQSGGHSKSIGKDLLSNKYNYVSYDACALKYKEKIGTNKNHRNYIIGAHIAHEFIHQIIGKSLVYIEKASGISDQPLDSHCDNAPNLMFPGEGGYYSNPGADFPIFFTKEMKAAFINGYWYSLYISKSFYPGEIVHGVTNAWERVSPTHKYIISVAIILYNIENRHGNNSQEYKCASKIMADRISKLNPDKYEITVKQR